MKSFPWYYNRLTKMSPPEVLYRVGCKFREKTDKVKFAKKTVAQEFCSGNNHPLDFDRLQILSPGQLNNLPENVSVALIDTAIACLENNLNVFGIQYSFNDNIDWHLDPKTGRCWPLRFWADMDIRDGFTVGGPKFVWEVNRLYCLNTLGMAYRTSEKEKYADKIWHILSDWMQANPYPYGINWTSGIELSIRIANLVWSLSFLNGYTLSEEKNELVNRFVWTHGKHLFRYPSRFSSNNNHAIAEAFALFLIGVFFPHFAEAEKWRSFGQEILVREVQRQILPDGGSYEFTTTYLSFVFDFFLLFKLVCDRLGIKYDPVVNKRLESSCEYIYSLIDCKGNIPNVGDQDSAVLVNFGLDNHQNFQSILNIGAFLFNRLEFKSNNNIDLKTIVLLGEKTMSDAPGKARKIIKDVLFPDSGLSVIRGIVDENEVVFVGNATPLGMPPLYAHGHLDALSFTLSVAGLEFIVDPGTYLYHSGGKWRSYFRSTAAHNTVRINQTDLTDMPGDFMYGQPYNISTHALDRKNGEVIWSASHDAYKRLPVPVSIARKVVFDWETGEISTHDTIESRGEYLVEIFFHFHPNCTVSMKGSLLRLERGSITVEMMLDDQLETHLYKGSKKPLLGWYSYAFNRLEETYSLVCRGTFSKERQLSTQLKITSCT